MSEECCGPDEHRKVTTTVKRLHLSKPLTTGDACCGPIDEPASADRAPRVHQVDGDACCGRDEKPATHAHGHDDHDDDDEHDHGDGLEVRPPWWRDTALLPSAIAGVTLLAGYVSEWTGGPIRRSIARRRVTASCGV